MSKTFIIAELGINHNGDLYIAKQLIKGAKDAGADAVKFQKRTIEKVYTKEELDKPRESPWGTTNREQKEGLEFSGYTYIDIVSFCKSIGIDWFASPWDLQSVDFLEIFKPKFYKIPSALLVHQELLNKVARLQKYTFISTGMSTLEEIQNAINIFYENGCPFEIMHCNSVYPAQDKDLNLSCIDTLRNTFKCKVGYSGHSAGIMDGVLAVCFGATSVEKHITMARTMYGSDQPASVEIHGFKKMIEYIRYAEEAIGNGEKIVTPEEEKIKLKLRRYEDVQ